MTNSKGQSGSTHKTVSNSSADASDFKVKLGSGEEVAPPAKEADTESGRKALASETARTAPSGMKAYVIKHLWYDQYGVTHQPGSTVFVASDVKPSATWTEVPLETARQLTTAVPATSDAGGKRVSDESPI